MRRGGTDASGVRCPRCGSIRDLEWLSDCVDNYSIVRYSENGYYCGMPRPRKAADAPDDFLPLPRDTFDVLVSLADQDRHGYAIMQDIAERTDGRIRLSPSTLYAVIKRLLESGLIEELSERPDPKHDDERRQLESDMRSWRTRLQQFDRDLEREPRRIREFYEVRAQRVEPVGLVYLWPETN